MKYIIYKYQKSFMIQAYQTKLSGKFLENLICCDAHPTNENENPLRTISNFLNNNIDIFFSQPCLLMHVLTRF